MDRSIYGKERIFFPEIIRKEVKVLNLDHMRVTADDKNKMNTESEKMPLIKASDEEEELSGCGATLACNPRRPLHRYLILIIMCFLSFG